MLGKQGFDYLGGYENTDSHILIRCKTCGNEHTRSTGYIRKGDMVCPECERIEALRIREEKREKARQEAETRRIERQWYRAMHPPKNAYEKVHEQFLNRSGVCEICGKHYTVREYVESCGMKKASDNGVCSRECRDVKLKHITKRAHVGRRDSHRHRAKRFGCEYDSSINLEELIKRDGLRCALCGEMCDMNDHSWSKYSGPMYPSIDHIIPMSKGGGHVWSNVQIAHIICNSYKGNSQKAVIT